MAVGIMGHIKLTALVSLLIARIGSQTMETFSNGRITTLKMHVRQELKRIVL